VAIQPDQQDHTSIYRLATPRLSTRDQPGLRNLDILQFRNFEQTRLVFGPGLNLITGENASGKTSLLEAIYYLGRVRSFRTSGADEPVRYGQPGFRLVGQVATQTGQVVTVGIERGDGRYTVHMGGQNVRRLSDLAGNFPVQIFSSDTVSILNGGPRQRRHMLDWALFHVEQRYRDTWQRYTRSLRQRNAALRAHASRNEVGAWESDLLEAALEIDRCRRAYLEELSPYLDKEIDRLLPDSQLSLVYQQGWPEAGGLADALSAGFEKDRAYGYTRYGPHRADFRLQLDGHPVSAHCSRGQQKAILLGIMLAQVSYQQAISGTAGAFLLDDLTSELDEAHRGRVLTALRELNAQVFVTAIQGESIDLSVWDPGRLFHVEHGVIHEVV